MRPSTSKAFRPAQAAWVRAASEQQQHRQILQFAASARYAAKAPPFSLSTRAASSSVNAGKGKGPAGRSGPAWHINLAKRVGIASALAIAAFTAYSLSQGPLYAEARPGTPSASGGDKWRKIRLSELKEHGSNTKDGRIWVSRGIDVYDITEWVENHPGGTVILRAAGGALEPYWQVFAFHNAEQIVEMLEDMKIGVVHPRDLVDGRVPQDAIEDPFADDPERDPRLIKRTEKPCNAETPSESLTSYITPNETFFTRNHLWVPQSTGDEWNLEVELPDGTSKTYTLADLKERFRKHTITVTLQCSGNRRSHMTANSRSTNGLQWDVGAVSNAEWSGVKLRDILRDAGMPVDFDEIPEYAKHVQFAGAEGYGASIPIWQACDSRKDVLLAFEMNGKPLPADHGAPLRALVPGNVAARSVKWLSRISVAEEESTSQWQRRDYKSFGPNQIHNIDWSKALAIQEIPVQSAITSVEEFSSQTENERTLLRNYGLEEDFVRITGYALSGGGRAIQRVDISVDGGLSWKQAQLGKDESKGSQRWSWTQWTHVVPKGYVGREIVVKAVDSSYNMQPNDYEDQYNVRGNLTTAYHRVKRPVWKS